MAIGRNVLVVCDASRGRLTASARELLTLARSLADALAGRVDLLALGAAAPRIVADAGAAGADRICAADGADRPGYHPEAFAAIALRACEAATPRIVLFAHDALGLDLAPRVAFGIGARWATNCIGIAVEGDALRCERTEVGGKLQVLEVIDGQAVATLRPKSIDARAPQSRRDARVLAVPAAPPHAAEGVVFVERRMEDGGAAQELEQATIVVTGGLGMGSPGAFAKLRELADALGASLAGSKQAVDRGWIPANRQVGLTGTTVAPKVYVAVAVSGALQHMAGCQKSRTIVAINSDPAAPIFRFARYGIVAKWEEVLPELLAQLSAARA